MLHTRATVAAALTALTVALLLIEVLSWPVSARLGPLASTTLPCGIRLDSVGPFDTAAGLRKSDVFDLPKMSAEARRAAVFHYTPTQSGRAGAVVDVAVQRGTSSIRVPVVLRHTDWWTTFAAQLVFKIILLGIALLVLWRGVGAASMMLALWCLAVGIALPDAWWGLLPAWGGIAGGLLTSLLWTSAPFLLYLIVESVAVGVTQVEKLAARAVMILLMLPALFLNSVDATAQAISGCWLVPVPPEFSNTAFALSQLVIVLFFILSYIRTSGVDKQRVRWVFWAFLFSRAGVVLNLSNRVSPHPLHLSGFEWASVVLFPVGCTYAILRHRIIDVNFVLNRTIVYTVLTSIVVGIFIIIENVLGKVAAGRGVGIAVDVSVALLLGFSFNALHRKVEAWIERVLFRGKHEAVRILRRLADEAPFMENANALLARSVHDVVRACGIAGVAVYERVEQGYALRASAGLSAPAHLSGDDLAFVRLRAMRAPIALADVQSNLGTDGVLFPFLVRGAVTGALLCRRRVNGEVLAPDEIALLASVAHEVGAEAHAIRARRQAELLDALLSGTLDLTAARALAASAEPLTARPPESS